MTHEEAIAEALRVHPISETVAERAARDPEYAAYIRDMRAKLQPLLNDLEKVGYKVERLAELRQWGSSDPALPILLHWLPIINHRRIEMEIISCLSVPWTGNRITGYLIERFKKTASDDRHYAWSVGSALSKVDVKGFEKEILKLCRNPTYGTPRQMIVYTLNRLRDPEAEDTALDLLEDKEVRLHAINALAQMKSRRALFHLEKLLKDKDAHIRKAARKAITRIMR